MNVSASYRAFADEIEALLLEKDYLQAFTRAHMMARTLKQTGNEWAVYRVPVCVIFFGAFKFRADWHEQTQLLYLDDAKKELKTFEESPCEKTNDETFIEAMVSDNGESIRDEAIQAGKSLLRKIILSGVSKSGARKRRGASVADEGANREPRGGRKRQKRESIETDAEESDTTCSDENLLPTYVDPDNVRNTIFTTC